VTDSADVLIVGGGVIGLTIARALALAGVEDVCLSEKGSVGKEASFAAAGILAPQVEADANDSFFHLACQSRDMYPSFAADLLEETGIDVELDSTGTLYVAFSEEDERDCIHTHTWQSRAGLSVEKLSASETLQLEPAINSAVRSALLFPNDIQVENRHLLRALVASVTKHNIRILADTSVEEVRVSRGKLTGVQTSTGFINCSKVVIAAGCWTSFIRVVGGEFALPQIEPIRGQMVCLDAKSSVSRYVIYSSRGYIVPRLDGRLLAGSTIEPVGFAKRTTAAGIVSILERAIEISPSISELPVADVWAGLRPKAADGLPVLGPCGEIDGLFYATGHYRNGILLAPITGELIKSAVLEGKATPLMAAFSPDRFKHAIQ